LSFSQTVCGGTGSSYSPFMVIAIAPGSLRGTVPSSIYGLPPRAAAEKSARRATTRRKREDKNAGNQN
jgi:hypothetical protein